MPYLDGMTQPPAEPDQPTPTLTPTPATGGGPADQPPAGPGAPTSGAPTSDGPPPGYGPGPGAQVPEADRNWILLAHLGGPVLVVFSAGILAWLAPLVVMLVQGERSPAVRTHAVQALNFQITWSIATVIGLCLGTCGVATVVGFFLGVLYLVPLVPIIFGIIGGVKASRGELYRYPLSYPFVR